MTRTTVSEAVTAVKEATTMKSIRDVLMACTVKDMVKVCAEVTGVENAVKTGGLKAQTAERIADFIMKTYEQRLFFDLPLAEKYAILTTAQPSEIHQLLKLCTRQDLVGIAEMLNYPLYGKYGDDREYCRSVVSDVLRAMRFERTIAEKIAGGADKESVKNELKLLPHSIHEALLVRAGIELEGALPRDVIIERLASHFMKGNQPTPSAKPDKPEPEINPDDTNEVEYELLQLSIDDSMEERTALKKAMDLLDPKSRDYSVLYGLYCCAGNEIEKCIERRRVIHKAITALEEVRVRAERQSAVA